MPQGMSIDHYPPRREVEQLQTHRQNDPSNDQTRPRSPQTSNLPVSHDTKSSPQNILHNPDRHVRRHIVCIVEAHKRQVRDVRNVHGRAEQSPNPQNRGRLAASSEWIIPVETEDADGREEEPVHHAQARSEVIQLLSNIEIARVEDHAEDPARDAAVSESNVIFPQRVASRDFGLQPAHSPVVCQEVEQREEDAGRFLNSGEAVEGPFAVELQDRFEVGRVAGEARLRYDVLAGIVAFGWAVPEEEAVLEGFAKGLAVAVWFGVSVWCRTD